MASSRTRPCSLVRGLEVEFLGWVKNESHCERLAHFNGDGALSQVPGLLVKSVIMLIQARKVRTSNKEARSMALIKK